MTRHLSSPELQAFVARELPSAQLLEADDHLAECAACRSALEQHAGAGNGVQQMESVFAAAEPHLEYEQVRLLAERKAVSPEVSLHAASCGACAREVAELRKFAAEVGAMPRATVAATPVVRNNVVPMKPSIWRSPVLWSGLAAAAVLLVVVGLYHQHATPDAVDAIASLHDGGAQIFVDRGGQLHGEETASDAWRAQLAAAMQTGKLEVNVPARLAVERTETMLGSPSGPPAFRLLSPVGRVSVSDRPAFTWNALDGAKTYKVTVYGAGYKKIVESPIVSTTNWQAMDTLPRGAVYTWTVTAEGGKGTVVEPAPPQPEAAFKVLEANAAAELQQAAASHPHDALLLAVLYARAGAVDEARAQIDALAAENPDSKLVAQLRESLLQSPSPIRTNDAQ